MKDEDNEGLKEEFREDGDEIPDPKPTTTVSPRVKIVDEETKGSMTKLMKVKDDYHKIRPQCQPKRNRAPSKRLETKPFLGFGHITTTL